MSFFDDDDDFQIPLTRRTLSLSHKPPTPTPTQRPSKIPKISPKSAKEIALPILPVSSESPVDVVGCSLDSIPLSFDSCPPSAEKEEILVKSRGISGNSIESKLLKSGGDRSYCARKDWSSDEDEGELDELLKLCSRLEDGDGGGDFSDTDGVVEDVNGCSIECPLCGVDISDLSEEHRHRHTNECIDRENDRTRESVVAPPRVEAEEQRVPRQPSDVPGVVERLRDLGLAKYEDVFIREEIDWESLQWLTEEDLLNIGITALGPRKKIVHAISRLRKESGCETEAHTKPFVSKDHEKSTNSVVESPRISYDRQDNYNANKIATNKLITDFFPGFSGEKKKVCNSPIEQKSVVKKTADSKGKRYFARGKLKDPPSWCRIPGTQFRVDAFRYLRGDCSHWFLTHFHMDHYQGLTKSFCHGKIYCSSITAKLVNMKIGISWERIHVLPLNQKVTIGGIDVTSLDANHCPGAIILLFEPPDGKAVLHTGDFRFSEDRDMVSLLKTRLIHTLILDTTYCDPRYDFPKQEAVIQFVLDAVQAESFNPKTLFLIGSYTIGKERLYLEVARVLHKKIYVNAAKQRILNCLDLPQEDMRWLTQNEQESEIHVVPMWSIASFKRLKHVANHYKGRFSLIVAFTPTGWTFDKGKKTTPGRKLRQGTIIRYEVPYSEHSSFTELKEFVKIVSPVNIIPSVNNHSSDSANSMVSLLVN